MTQVTVTRIETRATQRDVTEIQARRRCRSCC
jgi:hypothetical protein